MIGMCFNWIRMSLLTGGQVMNIRSQLLLVMVIASFITSSLVASVQMYAAYYHDRANMQELLQNQANQFSNQIETWFTIIKENGHFFVSEGFVQSANREEMQKLLGTLHNEINVFDNLIIAKPDGTISNVYPYNANIIGKSMKEENYFKATVNNKAPQISKVTINKTTGTLVIVVTQPIINKNGNLNAVLIQNIKLDLLYDMAEDARIGQTGKTIIFNEDGKIIAPNNPEDKVISFVEAPLVSMFKTDLRSVGQFTREDGTEVIAATIRVKTPGWGIAVTVTKDEVLQSFYESVKYGMGTFCIIFLLLTFIFSTIFNRLFRSITIVTEQFASMNEGNFALAKISQDLIRSAPRELRNLCTTFNTMSQTIQSNMEVINLANQELQQARDHLEVKVELRTQDLLGMNQELQAVNDELQKTLENLKETQTQLVQSEKMASLGNLVAGIAHEINTPVGVGVTATSHLEKITNDFTQLFKAGNLKRQDLVDYLADTTEAVSIIYSNLERASHLIRSFKQVSVDQSSEARRVFNIKEYLGEILLSLQPKLKRTQHRITITCNDNLQIDGYPGAFSQVITNLIMNSLIHAFESDQAGEIGIEIVEEKNRIFLTYRDNGKGMKQDVLEKIFNPFFTTKRGAGGTGLGLYIVYNIVSQQFGGKIECNSEIGKGTTFMMEFPLRKEMHDDKERG